MKLLLDTCTIFYISETRRLRPNIITLLDNAAQNRQLFVSPVSAWEIAMLVSKGKIPMTKHPKDFFETFLFETNAHLCSLDVAVMINSHYLPGQIHGDPMDRLLIETARDQDLTLVTSDRAILTYGVQGHVKTLAC